MASPQKPGRDIVVSHHSMIQLTAGIRLLHRMADCLFPTLFILYAVVLGRGGISLLTPGCPLPFSISLPFIAPSFAAPRSVDPTRPL